METINPKFHHITIKTSRLAEMIAWYGTVVGATVQFQDAHAAWMTKDAASHPIGFLTPARLSDDPEKVNHNGIHHSAFEYDTFADLISTYERLKTAEILPAFCRDHGLTTSLYYEDPKGNYVELQSDNFGDWQRSSQWMPTSPDFAANPIGTFFGPEKVAQAFAAGTPFNTLQPEMRAGKYLPATIPNIGVPQQ
jgi:catechol 2,3-dioxygenase